jgi:DNA repair protein RadA/Sms
LERPGSRPFSDATKASGAELLVLDSIQTVYTDLLESAPGSVGQVRECAAHLMRFAKESGTAVFVVGHVTKGGTIAGPRPSSTSWIPCFTSRARVPSTIAYCGPPRIVSARWTSWASFSMTERGLAAVPNPSAVFLAARFEGPAAVR